MLNAIANSLRDLASLDVEKDADDEEDDEEDIEQGKPSEDDELDWVMGTISKKVQQGMDRFRQKQMKSGELTRHGW